jgi:ABC-2 type transport system ATP-binding protein
MTVIEVKNLAKRYGETVAVKDVSFAVEAGEIFGILGPNGAGKTTTVECVSGLRTPDTGTITVLGSPAGSPALRTRIGVQLQESELQDKLTVREALELYSTFYPNPADWRKLVDDLGLTPSSRPGTASSPAARSSVCRSRWPCSATRRSPSWTS